MKRRQERVGGEIHRELSLLIQREIRDPRLVGVTVTGVRVSADLRRAMVYVTAPGEAENQAEAIAGLQRATPFLRRELGARMQLRLVPELVFEIDHSVDHSLRILELLDQIHREDEAK